MGHIRGILVALVSVFTLLAFALLLWRRYTRRVTRIPAYLDSYWDVLKERRNSRRFKKSLPVICNVAEKTGNVHHIFSKNISGEGLCLRVPEILPEGSQLDLKIEAPDDNNLITARGEVVWVKESEEEPGQTQRLFDTGIKFTKIEPEDKARLGGFLISLL